MSTRIIKINKIPRATPIPDIPINFPKFPNLHLELLEVKDKLKKGLPLIPRAKPVLKQQSKPRADETKSKEEPKQQPKESPKEAPKESSKAPKPDAKISKDSHVKKKESVAQKVAKDANQTVKEINNELGETENESSDIIDSDLIVESTEETVAGSGDAPQDGEDHKSPEEPQEPEEFDIYAGLSPEERLIKEREEYLWRFRILKKKYGRNLSVQIPEWNEFSDLSMMKTSYERTIRELYLDDTVETYRTYLVGSWIFMEYICTEHLSIDLGGFAVQQINMMYKYDSLLIELGEKSCERWTTSLPVEIRLIGMVLVQAAMFYLGKIITEKMGKGAGELFRGVTGQPPDNNGNEANTASATSTQAGAPRPEGKKMRGPKISADEIRARAQK